MEIYRNMESVLNILTTVIGKMLLFMSASIILLGITALIYGVLIKKEKISNVKYPLSLIFSGTLTLVLFFLISFIINYEIDFSGFGIFIPCSYILLVFVLKLKAKHSILEELCEEENKK